MAIIPTKDNFQIAPTGTGARFDGGPKPADVTRNGRAVASGLAAFEKQLDENERIDAAADANAFAEFLNNQHVALSERKGINAYRNQDGSFVRDTLNQNVENELGRMRSEMSGSKREKFDMMVLPFRRNFNRSSATYINTEFSNYQKATLENTKAQYGKTAIANYASDPESTLSSLNDFHGVARYQALKDGADEALADGVANNAVSGIVKTIIDDALDKGDLKTAQKYQGKFSKVMTSDDLIHANRVIRKQESIKIGEDFADRVFSVGAVHQNGGDMSSIYSITIQSESNGKRYAKNGKLTESSKGALGEHQVMPDTAKNPGFGIRPAKDNSPDELARVGREYLDKMVKRYGGDLAKMWGAYNAGPGAVDSLVKKHGADWLSYAPKETQEYVQKNVSVYQSRKGTTQKMMTVAEFSDKAKAAFGNNRLAYQAAVDSYSVRHRVIEEQRKTNQEETLNTIYDMADAGKTMTEIEQSGRLDGLDHKAYRDAVSYIRKNTEYDNDLLVELESNPDKLASTDLRTLRGKLSRSDINRLSRKQAIAQTDQGKHVLEKLSFEMKTVLQENGINLNSKKDRDVKTRSDLSNYMMAELEQFRKEHKRYPGNNERLEMLRHAVGEIVVPTFGGFWNKSVKRYEATKQDFIDSLSTPERRKMIDVANAAQIKGSDDEKILVVLEKTGGFFK